MLYNDEDYEVSTPLEINDILAELPFNLLKASLVEQINDPISTSTDYVETIVEKCRLYKKEYSDDEDICRQIDDALTDFIVWVVHQIDDRFGLSVDLNMLATYKSIVEVGVCIYRYFILRYSKNIAKFITNYIVDNKQDMTDYYSDKNKKDVTTLSYKKYIKDPQDLSVIVNLPSIVKYIITLDPDPYYFVDRSVGPNNFDGAVVRKLIASNRINGNFVHNYMSVIVDSHDDVVDDIQSNIRTRLIKKINKSSEE